MDSLSVPLFTRVDKGEETASTASAATSRGGPVTLDRLYAEYQISVYHLCYRLLGHEQDAQDAMQTTFVRAFRGLAGFRGECSLKTWLYRIAVNEATSVARRRRAHGPLDEGIESRAGYDRVADRECIAAALCRLRPDHRTILVLRFWEELSYEEIAAVLGVSLSAAKMRLQRARREFVRWYDEADR